MYAAAENVLGEWLSLGLGPLAFGLCRVRILTRVPKDQRPKAKDPLRPREIEHQT